MHTESSPRRSIESQSNGSVTRAWIRVFGVSSWAPAHTLESSNWVLTRVRARWNSAAIRVSSQLTVSLTNQLTN